MAVQLGTPQNADFDLTGTAKTVLTYTNNTVARVCQAWLAFGDGAKNLDGSGGAVAVTIVVAGQTVQPAPRSYVFSAAVRSGIVTERFLVPAAAVVTVAVLSPNAADVDVDVTATLFDVDRPGADGLDAIPVTAPTTVAATFREMLVQLHRRFFAKAGMTASALKTYADDGTTVVTTQTLGDDGVTQTQGAAT